MPRRLSATAEAGDHNLNQVRLAVARGLDAAFESGGKIPAGLDALSHDPL